MKGPLANGAPGLVAEHDVLPQRGVEHQPVALAVLRDVAEAPLATVAGADAGDVLAHRGGWNPAVGTSSAEDDVDQLVLAVALDAGDADDLAAVDLQVDVLEDVTARLRRATRRRTSRATTSPGGTVFVSGEGSSLPTISSASWRAVTSFGSTSATVRPARMTVMASATAQHLVELVGDEDDGDAAGDELAQRHEQLVDLLGHEHGGRLVEDDDARRRGRAP